MVLRFIKPAISLQTVNIRSKKPAIFDFNHKCQKLEKTVVYVDGFIYPDHICKIAIFGFLSIASLYQLKIFVNSK
jgi:hypothetical protein